MTRLEENNLRTDIKNFFCLVQRNPLILIEIESVRTDSIVKEVGKNYLHLSDDRIERLSEYMSNCSLFLRMLCEE